MTLSWRHTWPAQDGDSFTLIRERDPAADPEPEIIGSIRRQQNSRFAAHASGWAWSLSCGIRLTWVRHPGFATSGFEVERQDAADALRAAWAREEAFRAEVVAAGLPEGLSPRTRAHLVSGMPSPPRWRQLG